LGSWRDVEWVGLGPGWLPEQSSTVDEDGRAHSLRDRSAIPERSFPIPLSASIHATVSDGTGEDSDSSPSLAWDVEVERIKYRQAKEMEAYENVLRKAREVEKHVHRIRKEGGGKWVHFSFGGNGEEERAVLDRTMRYIDQTEICK